MGVEARMGEGAGGALAGARRVNFIVRAFSCCVDHCVAWGMLPHLQWVRPRIQMSKRGISGINKGGEGGADCFA